jgi:hypothetical protein
VTGGRSRLRRARRVVVGGLLGGAVLALDRRRRRREPLPARGSDPLAAFTGAPCYREAVEPPGGPGATSG